VIDKIKHYLFLNINPTYYGYFLTQVIIILFLLLGKYMHGNIGPPKQIVLLNLFNLSVN